MTRHLRLGALLLSLGLAAAVVNGAQAPDRTAPDRTTPPVPGPPPALKVPAIQKRTLTNGVPVWIMESHEVPLVQVNLVVLAGSADDPAGQFGLANLTATMLDEGAGSRSSIEIADTIDGLGATLAAASAVDSSGVRLNVPVGKLTAALPVMADVALRPRFPPADLERVRQERLTSLLQARDEAASLAALAFSRAVFGPTHRYGTGTMGTAANVKAFTREDLVAFHSTRYVPARAAFLVVGDVKPETLMPLLQQHFGTWAGKGAPRASLPVPPQVAKRRVVIVDKPGAPQSQIRIGWVGVPRSTADFFPLEVMNTMLGGSFTSRLNANLREEHGYSYGAYSAFDMRRVAGYFSAQAGVQTDKTAEAVKEFFNEFAHITTFESAELTRTKNNIALGYPAEFETSTQLSRKLEDVLVHRLADDYFDRYIGRVQAVTGEQVQKAALRHLDASRFVVVVVGDKAKIEAGLAALRLAPAIETMSVDQVMGGR
ncbi:MAG: pitrilysin family protein [Vicinamibacterales bacterium]